MCPKRPKPSTSPRISLLGWISPCAGNTAGLWVGHEVNIAEMADVRDTIPGLNSCVDSHVGLMMGTVSVEHTMERSTDGFLPTLTLVRAFYLIATGFVQ